MSQNEFRGKYEAAPKKPLAAFYPVIGLLVMVIAGAISYFAAPYGYDLVTQYVLDGGVGDQADELTIAVGVVIWLIVVTLFGAMFAVTQPKTSKLVSETALKQEKDEKEAERRRAQRRRKSMKSKMRKANKDFTDL